MGTMFGSFGFTTLRLWISTIYDKNVEYVIESRDGIIRQGTVNSSAPVSATIDINFQVIASSFDNREKGLHIYTTTEPGSIYIIADSSLFFNQAC